MSGTRGKRLALILVLAGAALALLASTRTWATGTVGGDQSFEVTGGSAAPGITALALVSAAGAVVLATAGRGVRRVVAPAVAAAGIGAAVLGLGIVVDPAAALLAAAEAASGTVGSGVGVTASTNAWPAVALLGAVLVAAGGVLAFVRGGSWAGPSARYERPAEGPGSGPAPTAWDVLSRGDDPTV